MELVIERRRDTIDVVLGALLLLSGVARQDEAVPAAAS
jgi:hypothetical protein